jgi:hypothetical protein
LKRIPRVIIRDCPHLTNGHDLVNVHNLTVDCPSFKDATMLGGVYHLDLGHCKPDSLSGLQNVAILEMNTFPKDGLGVFSTGTNQKIVFKSDGYSRYYNIVLLLSTLPAGYELIDELRRTSFEKMRKIT